MQSQIRQIEPGVIFYQEVPVPTMNSLEMMFEQVFKLSAGLSPWFLIVDIRDTVPPDREIRDKIRNLYEDINDGLKHIVLITGLSQPLAVTVKFVAGRSFKIPFSIVKDFERAMKKVEEVRKTII